MAPRDIYTHRLGKLEIGYPLFEPSTAELGDVGFINKSGGFIKLYNVAKPPKVNNAPPSRALKVTPPVRLEDSAQHVSMKRTCMKRYAWYNIRRCTGHA